MEFKCPKKRRRKKKKKKEKRHGLVDKLEVKNRSHPNPGNCVCLEHTGTRETRSQSKKAVRLGSLCCKD